MPSIDNSILLFGQPRSGTTWIGKVFDSHPDVLYRHEPDSLYRLDPTIPLLPDIAAAGALASQAKHEVRRVLSLCSVRVCGKRPRFPKRYKSSGACIVDSIVLSGARLVEQITRREPVWYEPPDVTGSKSVSQRYVWKSVESVGRLGVLLRIFPESKGVLIIRHPCGYVASVLRGERLKRFKDGSNISEDYGVFAQLIDTPRGKGLNMSLPAIRGLSREERLALRWSLFNQKALDDTKDTNNSIYVIYDEFCERPKKRLQCLFDFCGLNWNKQTDTFLSNSISKSMQGYYDIYKLPAIAANQWKIELSRHQIKTIESIVAQFPVSELFHDW